MKIKADNQCDQPELIAVEIELRGKRYESNTF